MNQIKDISVVIPTYNRTRDLKITLSSIKPFLNELSEVLVVDQSKTEETKNLVKSLYNKKIKYLYSEVPSITIARNLGVKYASKKSKIICFLDDDVNVKRGYFKEILNVFNTYPQAKAVSGYCPPGSLNPFENFLKGMFRFGNLENLERARITSAYGNTYPKTLKKVINSQWLQGVNMAYKKEVFDEQKFDENLLGYTIAEDIDFSFRLYKRYPNSVFITPFAKIVHRYSTVERYPTKKMAYINQIDHFYFNFKNLNKNFYQKMSFIWSIFGITLLRTARLISFKKINYDKWKYFVASLFYCLRNIKKIKQGRLREF